jgi:hypothetical protein
MKRSSHILRDLAHRVSSGQAVASSTAVLIPRFYAESIQTMMKSGKPNEYLQGFRFTPPTGDQGDRDKPFGAIGTTGKKQ